MSLDNQREYYFRNGENRMKIGQLAIKAGISKQTIHYYRNLGLLPEPLRTGLNLHLYDQRHLKCLKKIKILQTEENLSLRDIKKILEEYDYFSEELKSLSPKHDKITIDVVERRDQIYDDRRNIIIDTAAKLFSQDGYEKVRISDITDSLNMGKSTFYLYFQSKEEIFLACIDKLSAWAVSPEALSDIIREKNFFTKQAKRLKETLKAFSHYSGIFFIARHYSQCGNKDMAELAKKAIRNLARGVEKDIIWAQKKGYIRIINPEITSYMIIGMVENIGYRLSVDSTFSIEEAIEVYIDFLKCGLSVVD